MSQRNRVLPVLVLALVLLVGAGFGPLLQRAQRFEWIVAKKLTVQNDATFLGSITQAGDQGITGDLTVTGDLAVTDEPVLETRPMIRSR